MARPLTTPPAEARAAAPGRRRFWRHLLSGFLAALLLVASGVLLHRISDAVRGRPVEAIETGDLTDLPRIGSPAFPRAVEALAGVPLEPGHEIELLADEAVYERLFRDLAEARSSVTLTAYFCHRSPVVERLAAVLAERARAGVRVLFLVDGYGCKEILPDVRPVLEPAGALVAVLRPVRWYTLERAQHRNHARLVVIDGVVAYAGGFGLSSEWTGEAGAAWRDTSVRFRGPAVRDVQAAFLASWAEATGTLYVGAAFLPEHASLPTGGATAGHLYSAPGLGTTPAERALALSIAGAERSLFVANSYFVPPPLVLDLLKDASRRGVDVRLLLPGPLSDHATTLWAGRGFYEEMLNAGIRVFEYRETMLHSKTLVADGVWSWVGSLNLDNRSMRLNDENALLVHDPETGAALETMFLADLDRSTEITHESQRDRPRWERIRERITRSIAPIL